jgi:hypothetical protein
MAYSDRHMWNSQLLTLNGASDLSAETSGGPVFVAVERVLIHRIALTVLDTAAGGASVLFEDRKDTTTDASIETVVIPAANHIGTMFYTDLASPYELEPGHRLNLAVTESGTAPIAVASIVYSLADAKISDTDFAEAVVSA